MASENTGDNPLPSWLLRKWNNAFEQSKQKIGEVSQVVVSRPKIQGVPMYMVERKGYEELARFYRPQFISFGSQPFDDPSFALDGDTYKPTWTTMYLEQTNQTTSALYTRIYAHFSELLILFSDYYQQTYKSYFWDKEAGSWNMAVDGCSILQVLEKSGLDVDAERELNISIDKLATVHQDLLLLKNQIPFKLLKLLSNDEARLNKCLYNFLAVHGVTPPKPDLGKKAQQGEAADEHKVTVQTTDSQFEEDDEPVHLLDYLRRALLMSDISQINKGIKVRKSLPTLRKYRIGTIRELKAAGIRVKKNPNSNSFCPIFNDGKLLLPELIIDGSTDLIFLNLIAYEMCPDFRNDFEISSFVVFMNSLIDEPEDVKELRSAGILVNYLASDEEVASLFNKMDRVLMRPEMARFRYIKDQIQEYLESKSTKIKILVWMGEAYNTYFRSPWTIIALLAGFIGLVITFIQTWFAIPSNGSK